MPSSRDRLRLAPDVHSDTRGQTTPTAGPLKRVKAPLNPVVLPTPRSGAVADNNREEVPAYRHTTRASERCTDVRQSSRPTRRATSGPQRPAVKITPATSAGPSTSTATSA